MPRIRWVQIFEVSFDNTISFLTGKLFNFKSYVIAKTVKTHCAIKQGLGKNIMSGCFTAKRVSEEEALRESSNSTKDTNNNTNYDVDNNDDFNNNQNDNNSSDNSDSDDDRVGPNFDVDMGNISPRRSGRNGRRHNNTVDLDGNIFIKFSNNVFICSPTIFSFLQMLNRFDSFI